MLKERIIRPILFMITVLLAVSLSYSAPTRTPLSPQAAAKWREDITFLSKEILTNHPYLSKEHSKAEHVAAHIITKQQFERKVSDLIRDIPKMSEPGVIVAMMKLLASIGDAHTSIMGPYCPSLPHIPIYLRYFKDGTYVSKAAEEYKGYIGWKLAGIGHDNIAAVYRKMSALIPRENDVWLTRVLPGNYFNVPAYLYELGITADPDQAVFHFRTPTGERKDVTLTPVDIKEYKAAVAGWVSIFDATTTPLPIFEMNRSQPYWVEYMPEKKTIYFAYNECKNYPNNPLSSTLAEIDKLRHDNEVDWLIIDLRWNGGGNSALLDPFIAALGKDPKMSRKGALFCLIGNSTFSSAMLNAKDLRNEAHAILVGSPTGGAPNQFRNTIIFTLPNSKLQGSCVKDYYPTLPQNYASSVMPDVKADMTWSDYQRGIDSALEAIWRYQP